jgi:hypothetical protein
MYVAQSNQSMGPWTLRHSRHDSLAQPIFAAARDQVIDARLDETTLFECCVRERSEDGHPGRERAAVGLADFAAGCGSRARLHVVEREKRR